MDKQRRAELKQMYKQHPPLAGVFQIKNLITGKIFISSARNAQGGLGRHQLELKIGSHRNKALIVDWKKHGPENFSFEVLECLEPNNDPQYDCREDLAVLEELWLEKLQPYEEQGYNKRPGKMPHKK